MIHTTRHLAFVIAITGLVSLASAEQKSARLALEQSVPKVSFEGASLIDVIDYLRDVTEANIHVNWKALETMNVSKDTPITTKLRNVTLRKALSTILADAAGNRTLTVYADRGVIEITTRELEEAVLYTVVYPVDDILLEIADFAGPNLNLQSSSDSGSGNGGGGIFNTNSVDKDEEKSKTKTERAQDLVQLIIDTIQPEVWRDNGGPAAIKYFRGQLIVTAPRSVHEALGGPID